MLDPYGIMKVLTDRRAIYARMMALADPLAEKMFNRCDLMRHTVEAFDYAISEMAVEIGTGEEEEE